jgi:hypothetical protein
MAYLMKEKQKSIPAKYRNWINHSDINVEQSDIRPVVRAELNNLKREVQRAIGRTSDKMSRYHLQDLVERIDIILDPRG